MTTLLRAIAAAGLAVASAGTAIGQGLTLSGRDLYEACGRTSQAWIDFCNGYAQAVIDVYHKPGELICAASSTPRADIAQAIYVGLRNRPDLFDAPAAAAAAIVLSEVYRC